MTARSALKIFGCRLVANGTIDSRAVASDPQGRCFGRWGGWPTGMELGSSPRRFTVARAGRIVDRYRAENSDRKRFAGDRFYTDLSQPSDLA